jgi:hypothetical protein
MGDTLTHRGNTPHNSYVMHTFPNFFIANSSVYRQEPINVKNSLCGFDIALGWFTFATHFLFRGHDTFSVPMKEA